MLKCFKKGRVSVSTYQIDVSLWITRFNDTMTNVHQREDQQNAINDLNRILENGQSLKIQS